MIKTGLTKEVAQQVLDAWRKEAGPDLKSEDLRKVPSELGLDLYLHIFHGLKEMPLFLLPAGHNKHGSRLTL
jgi:hypothetical protein